MNKKVDEEYEGIKDVYILQCICSELKSQLQQKENIIKEFENEGYGIAQERADFLLEIKELKNIIKEVREYIDENVFHSKNQEEQELYDIALLEILDKEK